MARPNVVGPIVCPNVVEKTRQMMRTLTDVPECDFLLDYFMGRVEHGRMEFNAAPRDFGAIKKLFPELTVNPPHLNQVLQYYITGYPGFKLMRTRYLKNKTESERKLRQWYKEYYCFIKIKLEVLPEILEFLNNKCDKTPMVLEYTSKYNGDFFNELLIFDSMEACKLITPSPNDNMERPGSFKALLNYPCFEVNLNLGKVEPLLSLTRTFDGVYHRFVSKDYGQDQKDAIKKVAMGTSYSKVIPSNIQSVDFLSETEQAFAYDNKTVRKFIKTLVRLMNLCHGRVPHQRKQDIRTILVEFLGDVDEMNFGIATVTKMRYVIGDKFFLRKHFNSYAYVIESLSPTVALAVKAFNPVTAVNAKNKLYFQQLQIFAEIPSLFEELLLAEDTLSYRCRRCDVKFTTSEAALKHFQEEHDADVDVVCPNCDERIGINTLAERRWTHTCPE